MPNKKKKNQGRNAFYYFMVSIRPQLERQGVILENGMQSLAEIAGPRWKVLFFVVTKVFFTSLSLLFTFHCSSFVVS